MQSVSGNTSLKRGCLVSTKIAFATVCATQRINRVNNAAVGVLQSQVAALMGLTKTVIPNGNVCPGWGDVKVEIVTPTAATPAA